MTTRPFQRVPHLLLSTTGLLARRNRGFIGAWLVGLTALAAAALPSYQNTYATSAARRAAVVTAQQSTASTLIYGHLPDPGTAAQMYAWEIGAILTILTAVMATLLTARLTRDTEHDGTLELVRATGVKPATPAAAAMLVLAITGAMVGGLVTTADILVATIHPTGGSSAAGSLAVGACLTATFATTAATTALCAQAGATPRAARGYAALFLAIWFAQRAIGDVSGHQLLADLSPLGARGVVKPYTTNTLTPLTGWLAVAALLATAAFVIAGRRDVGSSLIRAHDHNHRRLRTRTLADFDLRLSAPTTLVWAAALSGAGSLLAAMGHNVINNAQQGHLHGGLLGTQVSASDALRGYFTYLATLIAVLVTTYTLTLLQRHADDERHGLVALVRATGRHRWTPLVATTITALFNALALLLVTGTAAAAVAHHTITAPGVEDPGLTALSTTVAQWPAITTLTGLGALIIAFTPRLSPATWLPLGISALLTLLGPLLKIPTYITQASALGHTPTSNTITTPQLLLLAIGVTATLIGSTITTHRDLEA